VGARPTGTPGEAVAIARIGAAWPRSACSLMRVDRRWGHPGNPPRPPSGYPARWPARISNPAEGHAFRNQRRATIAGKSGHRDPTREPRPSPRVRFPDPGPAGRIRPVWPRRRPLYVGPIPDDPTRWRPDLWKNLEAPEKSLIEDHQKLGTSGSGISWGTPPP